jgi:hypothetical protein
MPHSKLILARQAARATYDRCMSLADDDGNFANTSAANTALGKADEMLGGYGVEYIYFNLGKGRAYGLYYVNMGDPYVGTVAFNPKTRRFRTLPGGWGR